MDGMQKKQYVELQLLINEEIYVMPVYEKRYKRYGNLVLVKET